MSLDELLSEIYPQNDSEYTKELLEKHSLAGVVQVAIDKIANSGGQASNSDAHVLVQISGIASSFLTGINSKLAAVNDVEEKKQVELVISDVAFVLLKTALDQYRGDRSVLLQAIHQSLQTACEFNGYDFAALIQLFPLRNYIAIQPQNGGQKIVYLAKPVYYKWNSAPYNLNDLSQTLKSKNIIKSIKDFQKLFEFPSENLAVCFNKDYRNEVIVLIDVLYSKGHISPIGNRGHFMPLKLYGVDFENKPLIDSEAKTAKYTIKKNRKKWAELNDQAGKWLAGFK